MLDKLGKFILVIILTASVLLGGYLGFYRYLIELQDRTVELCVDLNDIKTIAAYEKKSLGSILNKLRQIGIVSVGLFEETLPDANAAGEIYYAKGSGILRLKNLNPALRAQVYRGRIKPELTYIYAPDQKIRRRIYDQLRLALGRQSIKFLSREIMEVNEAEEDIRELGLGLSEAQVAFLNKLGFKIIPRLWNDPRYHLGNIEAKIAPLGRSSTIIFDGEEILGYPDSLKATAAALKKHKIKYGYIEIVKQDGDQQLRRLMGREVVRVHSVPKRELEKLHKDEVVKRFVRAVRERKVKLIYMRPFLPPQVDAYPVEYNLKFFKEVKDALSGAGFIISEADRVTPLKVADWQIVILGIGVLIGGLFLLNHFLKINILVMFILLAVGAGGLYFAAEAKLGAELQKSLALLAAIIFPSLAVISSLAKKPKDIYLPWNCTLIVVNVVAEVLIGVFLLIGLLADYRYMLGVETFRGVKLALVTPIMIVALYFILNQSVGSFRERISAFLNTQVKLATIMLGVLVMGGLGLYLARSGNFVIPVPVFETYFRNILETLFYIRPRTKEFLIGYPLLFMAGVSLLRGRQGWLWLLAAIGTIAPVSVFNTFSHIHTPLVISMVRTVNGLVIGIAIGIIIAVIADMMIKKEG